MKLLFSPFLCFTSFLISSFVIAGVISLSNLKTSWVGSKFVSITPTTSPRPSYFFKKSSSIPINFVACAALRGVGFAVFGFKSTSYSVSCSILLIKSKFFSLAIWALVASNEINGKRNSSLDSSLKSPIISFIFPFAIFREFEFISFTFSYSPFFKSLSMFSPEILEVLIVRMILLNLSSALVIKLLVNIDKTKHNAKNPEKSFFITILL